MLIVDKRVVHVVVVHPAVQIECDVGRMAGNVRVAGRVGVTLGLTASFYAVQEVTYMKRCRIPADLLDLPCP